MATKIQGSPRERGGALLITILLMLLLGGLAGTLLTVQLHRDRLKREDSHKISSVYNADGALSYGVELIWNGYLVDAGGRRRRGGGGLGRGAGMVRPLGGGGGGGGMSRELPSLPGAGAGGP